jgi:hypothetical protein
MISPSPALINSSPFLHEKNLIFESLGKFGISEGANLGSKEMI